MEPAEEPQIEPSNVRGGRLELPLELLPAHFSNERYQALATTLYEQYFLKGLIAEQDFINETGLLAIQSFDTECLRLVLRSGGNAELLVPRLWSHALHAGQWKLAESDASASDVASIKFKMNTASFADPELAFLSLADFDRMQANRDFRTSTIPAAMATAVSMGMHPASFSQPLLFPEMHTTEAVQEVETLQLDDLINELTENVCKHFPFKELFNLLGKEREIRVLFSSLLSNEGLQFLLGSRSAEFQEQVSILSNSDWKPSAPELESYHADYPDGTITDDLDDPLMNTIIDLQEERYDALAYLQCVFTSLAFGISAGRTYDERVECARSYLALLHEKREATASNFAGEQLFEPWSGIRFEVAELLQTEDGLETFFSQMREAGERLGINIPAYLRTENVLENGVFDLLMFEFENPFSLGEIPVDNRESHVLFLSDPHRRDGLGERTKEYASRYLDTDNFSKGEVEAFRDSAALLLSVAGRLNLLPQDLLVEAAIAEKESKKLSWKNYFASLDAGTPFEAVEDMVEEFTRMVLQPYADFVWYNEAEPVEKTPTEAFEVLFSGKTPLTIQKFNRTWHNLHYKLDLDLVQLIAGGDWRAILGGKKYVVEGDLAFYEVNNVYQLHREAMSMQNCLATFAANCSRGEIQVFALRDRDFSDRDTKSLASLTVHRPDRKTFAIHDLTLPENGKPDDVTKSHAERFLSYLNSGQFFFPPVVDRVLFKDDDYQGGAGEYETKHSIRRGIIPWRALEFFSNDIWIWKRGRGQKDGLEFMAVLEAKGRRLLEELAAFDDSDPHALFPEF